jgi:hypothetical protein
MTEHSEDDGKLDVDAAWRSIVENYGEPAVLDEPTDSSPPPDVLPEQQTFTVFDRVWDEPMQTPADPASWSDEAHYVPPEPPPLPEIEPRRKLAWIGLFGSPLMLVAAVVFGWAYPEWFTMILVGAFVGGFGYLVGTMGQRHGDDSGDDGAVV